MNRDLLITLTFFGLAVVTILIASFSGTSAITKPQVPDNTANSDTIEVFKYIHSLWKDPDRPDTRVLYKPFPDFFDTAHIGIVNASDKKNAEKLHRSRFEDIMDAPPMKPISRPVNHSAYIRLPDLHPGTFQLFMKELEGLSDPAPPDTLFLDVRNNREGNLVEASKIANQLVTEGDLLLLQVHYFNGTSDRISSNGKVFFPIKTVVFLTDQMTSGPAEHMIRMLHLAGRGKTWGAPTRGITYVSATLPLSSGNFVLMPVGTTLTKDYTLEERWVLKPIRPDVLTTLPFDAAKMKKDNGVNAL